MTDFVQQDSIARRIWGNADMVLLVFAGSAAEFALNRAVDWLFFTGKLPNDPIGRLFSTAAYARQIVFAEAATAAAAFDRIRAAHEGVERMRGAMIPEWAYRDVLYMLIDYSERAHELLARPLAEDQQRDLYDVFYRVGSRLGVRDLPLSYEEWRVDRDLHLRRDLVRSAATDALYLQYRKHLGRSRYALLLQLQSILTPDHVRQLLDLRRSWWLPATVSFYPLVRRLGLRAMMQRLLIPAAYLAEVKALDHASVFPPG